MTGTVYEGSVIKYAEAGKPGVNHGIDISALMGNLLKSFYLCPVHLIQIGYRSMGAVFVNHMDTPNFARTVEENLSMLLRQLESKGLTLVAGTGSETASLAEVGRSLR